MLVWVVDPQKYADAALHNRYVKPFASHSGVMVFALNHIDKLTPDQRKSCLDDLERLLKSDGLKSPTVVGTSAVSGDGLDEVRGPAGQAGQQQALRPRTPLRGRRPGRGPDGQPVRQRQDPGDRPERHHRARRRAVRRERSPGRGRRRTAFVPAACAGCDGMAGDQVARTVPAGSVAAAARRPGLAPAGQGVAQVRVQRGRDRALFVACGNTRAAGPDGHRRTHDHHQGRGRAVASVGRLGALGDPPPGGVARRRARPGGRADRPRCDQQPRLVGRRPVRPVAAVPGHAGRRASGWPRCSWPGSPAWTTRRCRSGTGSRTPGSCWSAVLSSDSRVSFACRLFATSGAARRSRLVAKALREELEKVADSHVVAPAREELDAYTTCRDNLATARADRTGRHATGGQSARGRRRGSPGEAQCAAPAASRSRAWPTGQTSVPGANWAMEILAASARSSSEVVPEERTASIQARTDCSLNLMTSGDSAISTGLVSSGRSPAT